MAPARTGRVVISKRDVITKAQIIRGNRLTLNSRATGLTKIVAKKLTLPIILLAPAIWREKIARSTLTPPWKREEAKGG
jgi:hypothetical protein